VGHFAQSKITKRAFLDFSGNAASRKRGRGYGFSDAQLRIIARRFAAPRNDDGTS
jgi:hypothetical protein